MSNLEIKQQIDKNNQAIEDLITPGTFVLNEQIKELLEINDALRRECTHEFKDGVCIYCYAKEASNECEECSIIH